MSSLKDEQFSFQNELRENLEHFVDCGLNEKLLQYYHLSTQF